VTPYSLVDESESLHGTFYNPDHGGSLYLTNFCSIYQTTQYIIPQDSNLKLYSFREGRMMKVNQVEPLGHWVTWAMHLPKRNGSGVVSVAPQDSLNIKLLGIKMSHLFQYVLFVSRIIDLCVGKKNGNHWTGCIKSWIGQCLCKLVMDIPKYGCELQ
jgi:hypothetical protein